MNISKVLSNDWAYVADDIRAVIDVAHSAHRKVKVIFENCYLQEMHKIKLCEISASSRPTGLRRVLATGLEEQPWTT